MSITFVCFSPLLEKDLQITDVSSTIIAVRPGAQPRFFERERFGMNIIITAGGTTEQIDQVRKIANAASGRLASCVAREFVRQGGTKIEKIYYVCERGAIVPELDCLELVTTRGAESVGAALQSILAREKIDAVVHSMAVSDYTVESMTTAEDLADGIARRIWTRSEDFSDEAALADFVTDCILQNDRVIDRSNKVSSNLAHPLLALRQTPKLIRMVKDLQPETILVGFKLLDGVPREELLDTAHALLQKNACDFVLANDLAEISGERHTGYLLAPDRRYERCETKQEIAETIVKNVLGLYGKRKKK